MNARRWRTTTAAKPWPCDGCKRTIQPGERVWVPRVHGPTVGARRCDQCGPDDGEAFTPLEQAAIADYLHGRSDQLPGSEAGRDRVAAECEREGRRP